MALETTDLARCSPAISIALCTFNGARFLAQQLQSLADQTLPPSEIVIGDDGSSDGTLKIVEEFISSNAHVEVRMLPISAQPLGYRENFFRTAQACTGALIAFCDQDDVWRNDKLERAAVALSTDNSMLFFHEYEVVDSELRSTNEIPRVRQPPAVFERLTISPWTFPLGFSIVFRRELLSYETARLLARDPYEPNHPIAHDVWFSLLANLLGRTSFSPERLVYYRQHGANVFGSSDRPRQGIHARLRRVFRFADYEYLSQVASSIEHSILLIGEADERARKVYMSVSLCYALRSCAYNSASFLKRFKSWYALLHQGFYSEASCVYFGNHAAIRDLFVGVLLPKTRVHLGQIHKHDYSLQLRGDRA